MEDREPHGCGDKPRPRQREHVLVLVHSDGFLEVYAGKHVDVRVCDVPAGSTPEAEIAAEQLVDLTVPMPYRQLHWPDLRRAMHMPRKITAESISTVKAEVDLLRAIQDDKQEAPKRTWIA